MLASEGRPILSTPFRLQIPRNLYDEMIAHAFAELPNECCGLLTGPTDWFERVGRTGKARESGELPVIRAVEGYRLVNALASPVEYASEPGSMFDAVRDMRSRGLDIV